MKKKLSQEQTNNQQFLIYTSAASVMSGMIAKFIIHPFDTLKAKLQIQTQKSQLKDIKSHKILELSREVIKKEGFKGLLKGISISVLGTGPAFCLYMTTYEYSKIQIKQFQFCQNNDNLVFFCSGLIAESISCILWLPIDVIKERLQVQSSLNLYNYRNAIHAAQIILKTEGIKGLYRAYGATVATFGPYSALYFLFYESLKIKICQNPTIPKFWEGVFVGGLAGIGASFCTNGLDISKLRMQVQRSEMALKKQNLSQGSFGYKNFLHGLYLLIKNEGPLAYFKGFGARVMTIAPQTAISLGLTEYFRSILLSKKF